MKKINNKGYVLLETVIVSVFIIGIFTFVYYSLVPLIGKYEDLTHDYDIDASYKLYYIRDAIYKDESFHDIVNNSYANITSSLFSDQNYYNSLIDYLFENNNDYQIVYIKEFNTYTSDIAFNNLCSSLQISGGNFKSYIKKIRDTKASETMQNFIFLNDNGNFSYLGLAVSLSNSTEYTQPVQRDNFSHQDLSGAYSPMLADGMIPVYFDNNDNTWRKADYENKSDYYYWYDYDNFMWANVVLVNESSRSTYKNASLGTLINESDVMAYYVWIPRYEYYIEGTYGKNGSSQSLPGEIEINFINKNISTTRIVNGNTWRTATAFTFGDTELEGFWFAKFEMSSTTQNGYTSIPRIIPEVYSWSDRKVSGFYTSITTYMNNSLGRSIYGLSSNSYTIDSHMMKNNEWGAVAYLSQSKYGKYGNSNYQGIYKEVYLNNRETSEGSDLRIVTGSSSGQPAINYTNSTTSNCAQTANSNAGCFRYYVSGSITIDSNVIPGVGIGASTTGTIYGIYDMSGGLKEIVMGALRANNNDCANTIVYQGRYEAFTGFKGPLDSSCNNSEDDLDFPTDTKYYSAYYKTLLGCGTGSKNSNKKACYSEAMSETQGWYSSVATAVTSIKPWYTRGGQAAASSGIFTITPVGGNDASDIYTTRPIIAIY